MNRKILSRHRLIISGCLLLIMGLMCNLHAIAQHVISGQIIDDQGEGIPGVNILIVGTLSGTISDADGFYSLEVKQGDSLQYSFIGYRTEFRLTDGKTLVNVTLTQESQHLSEVVVTALGIERSVKALQSSVTKIEGTNFVKAREHNFGNALAGRVAGVNVTKIATGPAASSRVIIRGAKTLGSSFNQPLYVVDGVPISNLNMGQAGRWGGVDQGDGLTSLNPDDIESTTILKGASAAALYGSRASNGVILITTKKGKEHNGVGVDFRSNLVFETVYDLRDGIQNTHGFGGYINQEVGDTNLESRVAIKPDPNNPAHWGLTSQWNNNGWGPRLDGSLVWHWDSLARPYVHQGDNWDRFYQTGYAFTNNLAFTGGNENHHYRFSIANLTSESVIPNSGFDRFNISMSTDSKFGKKLTLSAYLMYANEEAKNRPRVSDSPGNINYSLWHLANDQNVNWLKGDLEKPGAVPSVQDQLDQGIVIFDKKEPGEEFQNSTNPWLQNPWWSAYQFRNSDVRDRIVANALLRYDLTDFFYLQGKAGMDWWTTRSTVLTPQGTGYLRQGQIIESDTRLRETNLEWMIGYNQRFGRLGIDAFFGGNRMRTNWEQISAQGDGFVVPFLAAINNTQQRNFGYDFTENGINSIFGSAELSWNHFLFITATWRRDWFTQLDPDHNSIDYPSIGVSFVLTDAINSHPSWLSFAKARISWGQVGNANSVPPYATQLTYALGDPHQDRPTGLISSGSNLPNRDLIPFTSEELELGFDIRFFSNRLGLDLAVYDQQTSDDILTAFISASSAFGSTNLNLGKMKNKGVEVLLYGVPIKGSFDWEVSLNFAYNNNEVVSLIDGHDQLFVEVPRNTEAAIFHIVGEPFGAIKGRPQKRSPDGELVYDAFGSPVESPVDEIIGYGVPDLIGGVNNKFVWRNFTLEALIDFKSGGDMYSGTNAELTKNGFTTTSLAGRDGEVPLPIDGVVETAPGIFQPVQRSLMGGEVQRYYGLLTPEYFVYDASFVKLRQLVITYDLPNRWIDKWGVSNVSLSLVGRNLALIYRNTPNIDPEASYSSGNGQGLDYFGMPATRSYGFDLNLKF